MRRSGVRISMDGKGRYLDNIFVERQWRSLKQEAIYPEEIAEGFKARRVIKDWMSFYNSASLCPSFYAVEENRFC